LAYPVYLIYFFNHTDFPFGLRPFQHAPVSSSLFFFIQDENTQPSGVNVPVSTVYTTELRYARRYDFETLGIALFKLKWNVRYRSACGTRTGK